MRVQKKSNNWNRVLNLGNRAKKGSIPWNKGKPRTKEEKKKISKTRKDRFLSGEIVHPKGMFGKKHTSEAKEKIKINSNTKEIIERRIAGIKKYALQKRIKVVCKQCNRELLVTKKRSKNFVFCSYKCLGLSKRKLSKDIHNSLRSTGFYNKWRKSIFQRDNYTCVNCGVVGGRLECHHIKPLSIFINENIKLSLDEIIKIDGLWSLNNGITLCEKCHKLTDSYGWKSNKLLLVDKA